MTVIIASCADGDVINAIPVQVANPSNGYTKAIRIIKLASELVLCGTDFSVRLYSTVGIQEKEPQRPAVIATVIISASADNDVGNIISIQVT